MIDHQIHNVPSQDDAEEDCLNKMLKRKQVEQLMYEMGFLTSASVMQQEQLMKDMFHLILTRDIMARNLERLLMVIEGLESKEMVVPYSSEVTWKWQQCGFHEETTGLFKIRDGEFPILNKHFKVLGLNRLQQKKSKPTRKPEVEKRNHIPKIDQKSKQIVQSHRAGHYMNPTQSTQRTELLK